MDDDVKGVSDFKTILSLNLYVELPVASVIATDNSSYTLILFP